jgi:hypothetical protein
MDHPAALHRIKVGVPATVEHSSETLGPDAGKWIAETTQVRGNDDLMYNTSPPPCRALSRSWTLSNSE